MTGDVPMAGRPWGLMTGDVPMAGRPLPTIWRLRGICGRDRDGTIRHGTRRWPKPGRAALSIQSVDKPPPARPNMTRRDQLLRERRPPRREKRGTRTASHADREPLQQI